MSASDKKKLRREQAAELLSEKQRQQQAEDKKLKAYTIAFVAGMLAVVCIALVVLGIRAVTNSGIIQKSTIVATVGDRELNTVELSYYYNDAISEYYNDWYNQSSGNPDTYLQMMGLDTTRPLDEQIQNEETGTTWADYFIAEAIADAKHDFALYDRAMEEGFALSEEQQETVENVMKNMSTYATLYGYSNADQYMRASYGYGATAKSYREYYERGEIAQAYYDAHQEGLTYNDAAMREYEADKFDNYSSFTYDSVYMSYTAFQQGGTEDEDGNITYSNEENDAARAALKTAAESLATVTGVDDLKAKVATLDTKEGSTLNVIENERVLYTSLFASNADLATWLADTERKDGDVGVIAVTASNTEEGEEAPANGYYIVIFHTRHDNTELMTNVRHLLVEFEGGEENEETGETTYTDEEKAAAKEKAEGHLKTWQEGDKTEEAFVELLKEHSDDTGVEDNEGLYENINPDSSYVENFLKWSIDPARKIGDAEVIETEYGYHVMYFAGYSEMSYRDSMITAEMQAEEQEAWYNSLLEPVTTAVKDTSKMTLDLILNPQS